MKPRQFLPAILAAGYLTVLAAPSLALMPGMDPPEKSKSAANLTEAAHPAAGVLYIHYRDLAARLR